MCSPPLVSSSYSKTVECSSVFIFVKQFSHINLKAKYCSDSVFHSGCCYFMESGELNKNLFKKVGIETVTCGRK